LLIPGKTRGHSLLLRATALALRRPRLQCFDFNFFYERPRRQKSLNP
jgi:hypothetical protein